MVETSRRRARRAALLAPVALALVLGACATGPKVEPVKWRSARRLGGDPPSVAFTYTGSGAPTRAYVRRGRGRVVVTLETPAPRGPAIEPRAYFGCVKTASKPFADRRAGIVDGSGLHGGPSAQAILRRVPLGEGCRSIPAVR